ncbi:hypothetical protein G6F63_014327 [Rhizopus arrhizus]|nr:hypothetical protein G6F63_014327 [Rhizopus arrhizus]
MAKEEWDQEKGEQVKTDELETVNQANALWARSKSDVTEEQYREFYKTVPQRIHAAAVRAQACPDGHVGPRRPPWREAVRQARVHHGRCRSAAAVVPAFRARRDRLGGPAAERVA